jgi:hypothetical protein
MQSSHQVVRTPNLEDDNDETKRFIMPDFEVAEDQIEEEDEKEESEELEEEA